MSKIRKDNQQRLNEAHAKIELLQQNFNLLCAAIADDELSRISLRCIASSLQNPLVPTPKVIEWAKTIIRNREQAMFSRI